MTIGAIITLGVLTLVILGFGICMSVDGNEILSAIISLLICVIMWACTAFYYTQTESGKRAVKTEKSNLGGGITREVKVYDIEGDLIQKYKGKFDVDYDDDRIIFDDENGMRHIIYYPTGTVIIDEVGRDDLNDAISELTYWHYEDGRLVVGWNGNNTVYKVDDVTRLVHVLPPVQPQRKRGEWNFIGYQMFECSSCRNVYTQDQFEAIKLYTTDDLLPKCCPTCGSYNGEDNKGD